MFSVKASGSHFYYEMYIGVALLCVLHILPPGSAAVDCPALCYHSMFNELSEGDRYRCYQCLSRKPMRFGKRLSLGELPFQQGEIADDSTAEETDQSGFSKRFDLSDQCPAICSQKRSDIPKNAQMFCFHCAARLPMRFGKRGGRTPDGTATRFGLHADPHCPPVCYSASVPREYELACYRCKTRTPMRFGKRSY